MRWWPFQEGPAKGSLLCRGRGVVYGRYQRKKYIFLSMKKKGPPPEHDAAALPFQEGPAMGPLLCRGAGSRIGRYQN